MEFDQLVSLFDLDSGSQIMRMSETDAAYIAGIVDGEGYICARRTKDIHERGIIQCVIEMSDDLVVPKIAKLLDINYCVWERKVTTKRNKESISFRRSYFRLTIRGNNLILLIVRIFPYLVLKREQVLLAFELLYLLRHSRGGKDGGFRYKVFRQDCIIEEIKKCNQKYKLNQNYLKEIL